MRLWFDPNARGSAAMARSATLLGLPWEGRTLDRGRLRAALNLDGARVLEDAPAALGRSAAEAARAAGVFTTPTLRVGGRAFVGLDALEDAGQAARLSGGLVTIGGGS